MKRLAFLFVVPFIVGFGHDKVRKCENLQNAINQSEKNYKQKISFTKYSKEFTNDKIAEIYGIDVKNSPYKLLSVCNELRELDKEKYTECFYFETFLKSGNYSGDDLDFMADERRQNADLLKEEFKTKYDSIKKQAKEVYLPQQKEMQGLYVKRKSEKVLYGY